MLQIRLSLPEFSNGVNFSDPIIMEYADNINLSKTVNSSDESISFEIPSNDAKIQYVTYLRWWECWDTVTNERLNYGPIRDISKASGENRRITGPGRSALLSDYYKSVQTFYHPIDAFFDDLRYENVSAQPRTSTQINVTDGSEYYGLSKRTKDLAIDEQTGYIAIGRDTPSRSQRRTDSHWAGTGRADNLVVDLGEAFEISKIKILLPWWSGTTINNQRTYDWSMSWSTNNVDFTEIYNSGSNNHKSGDVTLFLGETGFDDINDINEIIVDSSSIQARYWKLDIANTHAFIGSVLTNIYTDEWEWECNGSNVYDGVTRESPFLGEGGVISKDQVTPANDCYASAVELGFFRKILSRDTISKLSYKQIQNDSRQITYYHVPGRDEMIGTSNGKKFEPGSFFRKVTYTSDVSVDVKDEYNTLIHQGGSGTIRTPAYCRLLLFSDNSANVTYADTWESVLDPFSYGGSYSFSNNVNDSMTIHFRGVSFKWYATIPADNLITLGRDFIAVIPGHVKIELRSLDAGTGNWNGWNTLETDYELPTGVNAEKVWEITYESGILQDNITYEIRITVLEGFVSVDAFAGYWSGSFDSLNEDDSRMFFRRIEGVIQEYNQKYTNGSIYKITQYPGASPRIQFGFTGDRVIVYSRKAPSSGLIKIALIVATDDPSLPYVVYPIPGGESDGTIEVELGSTLEIPQAVIFDSDEYFDALPWGKYRVAIYKPRDADPIWVDGYGLHETTGLSVKFLNTTHLDILKATCEVLQMEWDIIESGVKIVPRIGTDTDVIFAQGLGTTVKIEDVEDVSQVATMLVSSGADIDGLPLSTIVENKVNKQVLNRTVQRLYDLRNVGDYYSLIGASRAELIRRRQPQRRITVTTTDLQGITYGDSFIAFDGTLTLRVRASAIGRTQSSSSGTQYLIECVQWPQII